jgi:hypothetical protein
VFNPLYWIKLILNVPAWISDILMVEFTFRTFGRAVPRKVVAKIKLTIATLTGKRAGDAIEAMMDLRNFTADHAAFVKALFESQFNYIPKKDLGRVIVCAAKTQPLMHLYQVEATWRKIAPAAELLKFKGTHKSLVHPPDGLAHYGVARHHIRCSYSPACCRGIFWRWRSITHPIGPSIMPI